MADTHATQLAVAQCEREQVRFGKYQSVRAKVEAILEYPDIRDLGAVAERLHWSSRTFKRRLRQEGYSFTQLLNQARKREAQRLLLEPGVSIESIAERLGYSDPANFSRAFRKSAGITPSSYRQLVPPR